MYVVFMFKLSALHYTFGSFKLFTCLLASIYCLGEKVLPFALEIFPSRRDANDGKIWWSQKVFTFLLCGNLFPLQIETFTLVLIFISWKKVLPTIFLLRNIMESAAMLQLVNLTDKLIFLYLSFYSPLQVITFFFLVWDFFSCADFAG